MSEPAADRAVYPSVSPPKEPPAKEGSNAAAQQAPGAGAGGAAPAFAEDLVKEGSSTNLGAPAVSASDFDDGGGKGGAKSSLLRGSKKSKLRARAGASHLHPGSPFMRRWDVTMMLMMLFTALVTPYEVAFMDGGTVDFLFVLNRLVDLLFLIDLGINFLAPYQGSGKDDGQWVHDGRKIAQHYLRTWFTIDVVSLLPYDIVGMLVESDDVDVSQLKVVRIVRLFRLLKLFRVLRASRIMKRWETLVDLNYKIISLVKFALIMCFVAHWMACGWALTGSMSSMCDLCDVVLLSAEEFLVCCPQTGSWMTSELSVTTGGDRYAASLYWAVMTLSTIGYGDLTAMNVTEQVVAVVAMLCGASLWAYVVGNVCGVVASLDVRTLQFRQTMDDLNYFMADKRLPVDLQRRLREYFHQARHMHQTGNYVTLFGKMSPKLRGDVALTTNATWISKVPYFRHIRDDCLSAIAVTLRAMVYAPNEIIPGNELHIVMRGVAAQAGRIITRGNVWGEDMILENHTLANLRPVRALTYIDVSAISREELFDVLNEFPLTRKKIQRAALLMAIVRYAQQLRDQQREQEARDAMARAIAEEERVAAHHDEEPLAIEDAGDADAAAITSSLEEVEARLQRRVEDMVSERVRGMESRFATMTAHLESLIAAAVDGSAAATKK